MDDPKRASVSKNDISQKKSIIDEIRQPTTKQPGWFNFLIPKPCDDFMHAAKSTMLLNHAPLIERNNIVATNYLNDYIYAFT